MELCSAAAPPADAPVRLGRAARGVVLHPAQSGPDPVASVSGRPPAGTQARADEFPDRGLDFLQFRHADGAAGGDPRPTEESPGRLRHRPARLAGRGSLRGLGFLACLPFVIVVMGLVSRWRSPDTQNSLLILLREAGNEWTIVGVVFTAVVSAPLTEELLFRVAFQGSLETRLPLPWAIGIPAVIFASVHGRYDVLPLLPLAIVLGVLYHLRRSYVACVTMHAMFNATFLVLALWQRQAA